ncbi:MAG: efflux RND transporter periplasmic adaptor subunit [Blastocatellia bacterium]|nr:efflux RND transporter periplasmic adaptor subunit [Blastocatellia bacterium]
MNPFQRMWSTRRGIALLIFAGAMIAVAAVAIAIRGPKPVANAAEEKPQKHEAHDHSHGDGDEAHPSGVVLMPIEQQWAIKLKHVVVAHAEVARQLTATGRIVPAAGYQVVLAPPVGGMITGGHLPRVGQRVGKGQTLAVLRQQVTAAEAAQIAAAQAQLRIEQARLEAERKRLAQEVEEAKAAFDLAVVALDHANKLYARKAYSVHQLLESKARHKAAEAGYHSAVQQAEALRDVQLPTAESARLNGFALTAPISGTVVKVRKAEGDHVTPGEAILEIVNLETVWVEASIFERDLHHLTRGARAIFTTPAYPGTEFSGAMVDLGATIDEQTRAATVVFQASNAGRALLIGMQANVRLEVGAKSEALLIPKDAVQENEGRKMVFVVVTGEEFALRDVALGDEYGEKVAVLSGLKEGERIVTQGAYQLRMKQLRPASGEEGGDGHHHHHDH